MSEKTTPPRYGRLGDWLPYRDNDLISWLEKHYKKAETEGKPLYPVMQEFKDLLDNDPIARMQATMMIEQVPHHFKGHHSKKYHNVYLKSIDQMIRMINAVLDTAPVFNETELVGCPINAIVDWCMFTPAGCAFFANSEVNKIFKKILNTWSSFLDSSKSLYVLNRGNEGWMCKEAISKISIQDYQHDPEDEHWGFKSWNDFFTRELKKGVRPIADPDDNKVVVSSCDSGVFAIQHEVNFRSKFWIKAQPYSLNDMFNGDPVAKEFVGGDVYQAFLSAYNYHRWNSPVNGTVLKSWNIDGTYYSEAESEGADPGGPDRSQGYISQVAARAVILIRSDDPTLGLVAMIYIGMAEISSCKVTVPDGHPVKKGDEIGHFQYGGSTHCMVFQKGAIKEFYPKKNENVKMGEKVALAN